MSREKKNSGVARSRDKSPIGLVSLMKLHRGMYTLKQFILMSISAIFGRDHSLLITWGGGRCRNIFFSGGGSIEVFFWGEGGIKLFYFGGITWFSGQTESVVADRVLNWGDYKNWMPRYLLSWFLCHTSDPSSKASTSHVFTKFKSWSLIPLSLWERWRWSARSTPGQEVWIRGLTRKLKCICGQDTPL